MIKLDVEAFANHPNIDVLYTHCGGRSRTVADIGVSLLSAGSPSLYTKNIARKTLKKGYLANLFRFVMLFYECQMLFGKKKYGDLHSFIEVLR